MTWAVVETTPESDAWQQLLAQHEHLLFHEAVWAHVLSDGFGSAANFLLLQRDGETLGGLAGFTHRVLWAGLTYFNLPYGGVVGSAPSPSELAALLRDWSRGRSTSRIRIAASPCMRDPIAAADHDNSLASALTVYPLSTHILDLAGRDYESVWMSFKGRVRRDVRKAEKSGVHVSSAAEASDIDAFYALYRESMVRNQAVAKYPRSFVQAVADRLIAVDRGALLLAMHSGRPIAGMLLADSAKGCHYLMAGSLSEGLQYCPNDLLLNHALVRAIDHGYDFFDFLPSGENDTGLENFKSKWDAARVDAPVYELITKPGRMRAFDFAYSVAQTRTGRAIVDKLRRGRR